MFHKTTISVAAAAALALLAPTASAALYTSNLGSSLSPVSDCDDCFAPKIAFGGGGTLNFFGGTYDGLFVGSNGYVTFGAGATGYSAEPLNTQTTGRMIAGLFTDLDSRGDASSQVFANTDVAGQIVVTWNRMGHFAQNYGVRSTFQLVIRSDQFVVPDGQGRIGFFYDRITDTAVASAGFGDGLDAVNPGEVAFASRVAADSLSNRAAQWYTLSSAGIPLDPAAVPLPGSLALLGIGLVAGGLVRRRV